MAAMAVAQRTDSPIQTNSQRHSVASSAASFQTARNSFLGSMNSPSSSRPASAITLGQDNTEPVASVSIVQVTDNTVRMESPESFLPKVPTHLTTTFVPKEVGPPPPSPPSSVTQLDENASGRKVTAPKLMPSTSEPFSKPLTFEEPPVHRRPPSPTKRRHSAQIISSTERTSLDTKSSSRTTIQPIHTEISQDSTSTDIPISADGFLQPPSSFHTRVRPARRNTTGSTPRVVNRHIKHSSEPEGELAQDIQIHAERIRRERLSRRAKAQEEEASTPKESAPLVGNLIGEGHVNYVLMYNMLTGIRIGVSRCQAKIKRALTDEDFTARHKFSFDIVGNELTPSAKYDFKFKDYAPWVFRELREDIFHLDPADYLVSLTEKYILSELGSPGKSGSFFYFSRDYRFIIKTIHHSEHKFLLRILKQYHAHVKSNPHTLLSRFYGLHRVKLPRGRKIHFVIMNNLFPSHRDIHETYDLKGSTVGRLYPEDRAAQNPRAVLKDVNWIDRHKMLELGPEKRALLTEQLRRDMEFLKSVHVMDYSLLVGIHNMQRGNRDNVRRNTLKVFTPDIPQQPVRRKPTQKKGAKSPEAIAMRRAVGSGQTGSSNLALPEEDTSTDRQYFLFYQDEGGLRATGEENEDMDTIYYLGVIDILTPYTLIKRAEHVYKGMKDDRHKISPVPPIEYGDRFFAFLKAVMRGGGGGERFKAD